jgi:cardiolipin synthase (CMP-forming)
MGLPNLITLGRILLVPVTVWLMISQAFGWAFVAFLVAGISDGVDGAIARRYDMKTELGTFLDPIADKALLVSIYITLGTLTLIPVWLVILIVSRDMMIVGGVILAWIMDRPLAMNPSLISKVNTAGQIAFAGILLGLLGIDFKADVFLSFGIACVAGLTLVSGALYLRTWIRHMAERDLEQKP